MKLNLASGTDLRAPPWVNLDIVPKWPIAPRGCDVIWDARTQEIPFPDGSADEVYAGYLFLHLAPHHHERVLRDIRRVMGPGGRLLVGEVAMDEVVRRWVLDPADKRLAELIWGEQGDVHGVNLSEFDKHCHGFTEKSLREFLAPVFGASKRVWVHSREVWYELTMEAFK